MTTSQTLNTKLLAVLAGATNEGEAMSAWRKLRRGKPEGWLFEPGSTEERARDAYQRGWSNGFAHGYRAAEQAASLGKREEAARSGGWFLLPRAIPLLPDFLPIRLQGVIVVLGWYGLISLMFQLVVEVLS